MRLLTTGKIRAGGLMHKIPFRLYEHFISSLLSPFPFLSCCISLDEYIVTLEKGYSHVRQLLY